MSTTLIELTYSISDGIAGLQFTHVASCQYSRRASRHQIMTTNGVPTVLNVSRLSPFTRVHTLLAPFTVPGSVNCIGHSHNIRSIPLTISADHIISDPIATCNGFCVAFSCAFYSNYRYVRTTMTASISLHAKLGWIVCAAKVVALLTTLVCAEDH